MGFIRFLFEIALVVAVTSLLLQKYSPETIENVKANQSVQKLAAKLYKFIIEARESVIKSCYPLYLMISDALKPISDYIYVKFDEYFGERNDAEKSRYIYQNKKRSKEKVFSPEELANYDGKEGSKGLYLGLLGKVFDVKKGKQHYGPGGGYEFFAGRDASRAFVSGSFDAEGLIDDIEGLSYADYLALENWLEFYKKDYKYIGKVAGRYYNEDGSATEYKLKADQWIAAAKRNKDKEADEKKVFPPCNTEWSQEKGLRVWCTKKSGGVERSWAGVPRKYYAPGSSSSRCACVKDYGDPSSQSTGIRDGRGDLGHPSLREYSGCTPKASSCELGERDSGT